MGMEAATAWGAAGTAWGAAAAALMLAAFFALRAGLCARASRTQRLEAAEARATAALAATVIEKGATGAVRLDGRSPIGAVDEGVTHALSADGIHSEKARALIDRGEPFSASLGDLSLDGMLVAGAPAVLVSRANAPASGVPASLAALLAEAPFPVWAGGEGAPFANAAYRRAAAGGEALLDANARTALETAGEGIRHARVQTVVAGARRTLEVAATKGLDAAIAVDLTDDALALARRTREVESQAAIFDRLATAIATFGPDRRLAFHNAAFATLWGLSPAFLEGAPTEEAVLDTLRTQRKLPEVADFAAFKRDQLHAAESRESTERWWHLPDGQSLRVIASPGADGGVTTIYENVTEQLALEARYNALSRVQAETIDNLGEGIATFGPDGLLRLANPAFWTLSGAAPAEVGDHVGTIAATAQDADIWADLAEHVTSLTDHRMGAEGRLERAGRVLDYAFAPLPDGATLATFTDVTDRVNVARALQERNTALEEADGLKNAFIEHVSYELRTPLNTILGYTQLLTRPETGALSARQREYASHISTSSEALIALIDGILDLATIDAGIMELEVGRVDVAEAAQRALDGLKDRVADAELTVRVNVAPDADAFEGDAKRVGQILFNLLSNAVAHSPHGGEVAVTAWGEGSFVAIAVRDYGEGIEPGQAEAVFERFMTGKGAKGRRAGVGLGLSLVKGFVELHGGRVALAAVDGPGTAVEVRFPRRTAAETPPAHAPAEEKRAA